MFEQCKRDIVVPKKYIIKEDKLVNNVLIYILKLDESSWKMIYKEWSDSRPYER